MIHIAIANQRGMHMEERLQEASLFIVLLKEFLREPTFLSSKVQQLFIQESATKLVGKDAGYFSSATSYLSADVYYNFILVFHIDSPYVEV